MTSNQRLVYVLGGVSHLLESHTEPAHEHVMRGAWDHVGACWKGFAERERERDGK